MNILNHILVLQKKTKLIDTYACGKFFKSKDLLLIKDFLIELSINQKKYDHYAKKASFSFTKENAKSFL
jgi:hypothetical protein